MPNLAKSNIKEEVMEAMKDLSTHLEGRVSELKRLKGEGKKIVGYITGGFMPEELVLAGGAIPVGLNRGGDHEAVLKSTEYIPRFIDAYSRAQIGCWALEEPLYRLVDLVVVHCTDKNISAIADCWEMWTETKVLKLGVPHNKRSHAFKYYLEGLHLLREEIEKLTGNTITENKLRKEIDLSNRMRFLLRQISGMRKAEQTPISGKDYIRLHHASFLADRDFMLKSLEALSQELKGKEGKKGPRILLVGSSMAEGDDKVYDLLESAGADVVIEEFSEGMRPYWQEVEGGGDLIEALADGYFRRRTPPPAFFRPATEERVDFLLELAREFRVDGIIWYSMLYRDSYDIGGIHFGRIAEREGLPFIKIVSEYDTAEQGQFRTRIEALIESIEER
jgi:benzoyl-CoA reductase/2-hydroxyglutaryl-CoA dehydratase subunit BcrC/BadD/HgdB